MLSESKWHQNHDFCNCIAVKSIIYVFILHPNLFKRFFLQLAAYSWFNYPCGNIRYPQSRQNHTHTDFEVTLNRHKTPLTDDSETYSGTYKLSSWGMNAEQRHLRVTANEAISWTCSCLNNRRWLKQRLSPGHKLSTTALETVIALPCSAPLCFL